MGGRSFGSSSLGGSGIKVIPKKPFERNMGGTSMGKMKVGGLGALGGNRMGAGASSLSKRFI